MDDERRPGRLAMASLAMHGSCLLQQIVLTGDQICDTWGSSAVDLCTAETFCQKINAQA